jgi:F-type H+-transporting ATPase subunit epsilon
MPEKFKVEVVTPQGVVLDKEVEEVIAPGIMGEFGVLIGHTPMLTFIKPGILSYLEDGKFTRFAVGDGFCEVLKDAVTVLVEEAFAKDAVDAHEASAELKELEHQLEGMDSTADPEAYQAVQSKIKLARAKVSLAGES